MLGDKIVVKPHHTRAAEGVYEKVADRVSETGGVTAITVAGESGSGKSETASEIARIFSEKNGYNYIMLHQDDYFVRPPKTNDSARREDISNVGMHEVRLNLMDEHIREIKSGRGGMLKKPLIDYDNDIILEEEVDMEGIDLVVAEGTYTTVLSGADIHVFIDRSYEDTLEHRKERARDSLDEFANEVLKIEHDIISSQKKDADVIIDRDYNVM